MGCTAYFNLGTSWANVDKETSDEYNEDGGLYKITTF